MDELLHKLQFHVSGMWNRRWIGLGVAWVVAILAIAVAFRVPEKFEATARVYVDTQSLLRPVMAGLSIQPNLDQQVALMSRTLLKRPNVEKLVQLSGLDVGITSVTEREALIEKMMNTLKLDGNSSTNLYVISYRDPDPHQAKAVVESLLKIFVESSVGDKRQDTRSAIKFLDEQISRYEESLQTAESRLKDFKLKYIGIAGQSGQAGQAGQDYFGRMSRLSDDIANAKLELRAAMESRDSYKRGLAAEAPSLPSSERAGATISGPAPEIDVRLAAQKAKLDEMLRSYTDQHPDVVGTRRVITELEEQRRVEVLARERAARAAGRPIESMERNPAYQSMRVALAEAEAKVAALQARLSSYEGQYAQLKASARLVPEVEAEFAQLNRDYDIQKTTYGQLLARREAATMGVDVQDTEAAQFRTIDPPRVSPRPVAPSRGAMLALAFIFSLSAGLLASFVANEIMPTFHDARSLREFTDRPILGTLSSAPIESVRREKRRDTVLFAGGFSGLIASFAAVIAVALLMSRVA
jgi:polysaccharide chain length determinant protein (PEP-CTERM system associated)